MLAFSRATARAQSIFLEEKSMDKTTVTTEIKQTVTSEQPAQSTSSPADQIKLLAPECLRLIGGGQGIVSI
jgi:hypothetical protein